LTKRENAPQLPEGGGGCAQLELTDALTAMKARDFFSETSPKNLATTGLISSVVFGGTNMSFRVQNKASIFGELSAARKLGDSVSAT